MWLRRSARTRERGSRNAFSRVLQLYQLASRAFEYILPTLHVRKGRCSGTSNHHHHQMTPIPYELHIRRTGHKPPRDPSAGWWVLTTANAAGTNGLACLRKRGRIRDNTFLVTHPMIDQHCLTSTIACQSALTTGQSRLCSREHLGNIGNIKSSLFNKPHSFIIITHSPFSFIQLILP
jgi:hypothetical protein